MKHSSIADIMRFGMFDFGEVENAAEKSIRENSLDFGAGSQA